MTNLHRECLPPRQRPDTRDVPEEAVVVVMAMLLPIALGLAEVFRAIF